MLKKLLFLIIISFLILNQINFGATYWGYGEDCRDHHGIQYIDIPYSKDATINLDGIPSESFWNDDQYTSGKVQVPLASNYYGPNFLIIWLNLTFIMNDNYIYILAQWKDNTTRPSGGIDDGILFCWNIDVPNFSAAFFVGMNTNDMGGGYVDSWVWKCRSTSPSNGSSYECTDDCFGPTSWVHSSMDIDDVLIAYTYRTNYSYTLEISRKIDTTHEFDVQFTEDKLYEFNLGILNNGTMIDHAISWTYALDLREEDEKDGDNKSKTEEDNLITSFLVLHLIFYIILISIFIILYNKRKILLD